VSVISIKKKMTPAIKHDIATAKKIRNAVSIETAIVNFRNNKRIITLESKMVSEVSVIDVRNI